MTAPVVGNLAADHPAKWSTPVLDALVDIAGAESDRIVAPITVLDPFAGIGRSRLSLALAGNALIVDGVELQPEWCSLGTMQGDALNLPDDWTGHYHAVITSPVYGNRASDHHDAKDPCKACAGTGRAVGTTSRCDPLGTVSCSKCKGSGLSWRITYAHALRRHGGEVQPGSSAVLAWGREYRAFHRRALAEMIRVVTEGGLLAVNMSNHVREGTEQLVAEWWVNEIIVAGCQLHEVRRVSTRRQRNGANRDARVDGEVIIVAHTPNPRRLV